MILWIEANLAATEFLKFDFNQGIWLINPNCFNDAAQGDELTF